MKIIDNRKQYHLLARAILQNAWNNEITIYYDVELGKTIDIDISGNSWYRINENDAG